MTKRPLIETAVFPVAGRGTRFLPATKASPKEMLPVVDKPLIQYAVEEALAAGARRLVFITGASKRAIEDHFDSDRELESLLKSQGKSELVKQLHSVLPSYATCIYIRQPAPLGLGHAVLCARPAVGNEPFFVHLADDLIAADEPVLLRLESGDKNRGIEVLGQVAGGDAHVPPSAAPFGELVVGQCPRGHGVNGLPPIFARLRPQFEDQRLTGARGRMDDHVLARPQCRHGLLLPKVGHYELLQARGGIGGFRWVGERRHPRRLRSTVKSTNRFDDPFEHGGVKGDLPIP